MSEQRAFAVILILLGLAVMIFARSFVEGRLLGWIKDESWIKANTVVLQIMALGIMSVGVYLLVR